METLTNHRILHDTQLSSDTNELLCIICIICNTNKPRNEFNTSNGIRVKCTNCTNKLLEKSRKAEKVRKEKRIKLIEEHNKMIQDNSDIVVCTKCKKYKNISSFKNERYQLTNYCYECRQYSKEVDSRREPRETRTQSKRIYPRKKTKYTDLAMRYCMYRRTDVAKGFCNELNFESILPRKFAYSLMQNKCSYCNILPDSGVNGLDRVDNTKGHTPDNVVCCCETCNICKNDMPLREFVTYTQRISSVFKYILTPTKRSFECPF
jgi:hypothetical protein